MSWTRRGSKRSSRAGPGGGYTPPPTRAGLPPVDENWALIDNNTSLEPRHNGSKTRTGAKKPAWKLDSLASEGSVDGEVILRGGLIVEALAQANIEFALAVPDIVTAWGVLTPISRDSRFKLVRVCKEDECIGIAAALSICGRRAVSLFQNTGFLDSINAIVHIAVQYDLPTVMMIGLLAHDAGTDPRESERVAVRIVQPMLDNLGIESMVVDRDSDANGIAARINAAFVSSRPLAILIGRRPVP